MQLFAVRDVSTEDHQRDMIAALPQTLVQGNRTVGRTTQSPGAASSPQTPRLAWPEPGRIIERRPGPSADTSTSRVVSFQRGASRVASPSAPERLDGDEPRPAGYIDLESSRVLSSFPKCSRPRPLRARGRERELRF